jgi:hypothetical protein
MLPVPLHPFVDKFTSDVFVSCWRASAASFVAGERGQARGDGRLSLGHDTGFRASRFLEQASLVLLSTSSSASLDDHQDGPPHRRRRTASPSSSGFPGSGAHRPSSEAHHRRLARAHALLTATLSQAWTPESFLDSASTHRRGDVMGSTSQGAQVLPTSTTGLDSDTGRVFEHEDPEGRWVLWHLALSFGSSHPANRGRRRLGTSGTPAGHHDSRRALFAVAATVPGAHLHAPPSSHRTVRAY